MDGPEHVAEQLFGYLRDVIFAPGRARLDLMALPPEFHDCGRGLEYLVECITEARMLAEDLSRGELDGKQPSPDNEIAAPLKSLHASLKHLTWQAQQVAKGNYTHRVEFMGEFAQAFNDMIEQLEKRTAALVEAKLAAEAENRIKSKFLAAISHEIRTPLNAVIGLSEIQLRSGPPEAVHADLEKIHNAGVTLLGIVNELLDISKIEAGGFELVPVGYSVASLLNDVIQLNIVRIGQKKIDFVLELDESIPSALRGDELRIKQVLTNLLSNAFKYTVEGQVRLRVNCEKRGGDAWLTMAVSDTGIGIREEDLDSVFTEYRQFDMRANRRIEGTGLGLAITKILVEKMGGAITVASRYGEGSVFTARIRQEIVDGAPMDGETIGRLKSLKFSGNRDSRKRNMTRTPMPYGKALVVDDIPINLVVAKGLLAPYGLTVDCVQSGWEAVELIRSGGARYDVVFMDHMMPDLDGVETTRIIRNEIGSDYAKTVPIVALTANAVAGSREALLASGFSAFISKPIDILELDGILNEWVRDRRIAQARIVTGGQEREEGNAGGQ